MKTTCLTIAASVLMAVPLSAQVRKLHTRDLTRLSQVQVADYLKRSDIIFIPIGAVETNGIMPSDRDYVSRSSPACVSCCGSELSASPVSRLLLRRAPTSW